MKLNELEIKIALNSRERLLEVFNLCQKLLGPPQSQFVQLDEYYDTSDRQLKKQDLVLRIRTVGEKKTIALKSPRIELESGMTSRIELEFLSAESDTVQKQLADQGLKAHEASEKQRWIFVHQNCEIVIDQLPFIGAFIEIEGPSEEAINEIVQLLNLSSCKVIRQNYGELMTAKFQELLLPLDNICATFAKEKELKLI